LDNLLLKLVAVLCIDETKL